jgi:hypothetical protein
VGCREVGRAKRTGADTLVAVVVGVTMAAKKASAMWSYPLLLGWT